MKIAGVILLVVGLLMTLYTGFTYFTKEKVVDIGSLEITADKEHKLNWQPYVGVGVMLLGGVLIVVGKKNLAVT